MWLLYEAGIRIFYLLMRATGFVNSKAKEWIIGQKAQFDFKEENPVWFHCASLGEYKQAKPLIDLLMKDGYEVVISFFSPSGYLKVKDDISSCYLPLDTRYNANAFVRKVNPQLAIFIRSEYWFNYIDTMDSQNVPLVFINSYIDANHYLLKWYGKWFMDKLKLATFFYTIDKQTSNLLLEQKIDKQLYVGDTKVDQVVSKPNEAINPMIQKVAKKIILAASTEYGDTGIINTLIQNFSQDYLIIIVPHENTTEIYRSYERMCSTFIEKYSSWNDANTKVLYVDQFGILPSLFKHCWLSYIGGGFDKGIHNVLESCVENKPMIFGKNYHKFPEAELLLQSKSAVSIQDESEIISAINYFEHEDNYKKAVAACATFINENKGATQKIYNHLKSLKLLK